MDQNSRKKATRKTKPAKPYPDFPLFPHQTGRWCKKIRGRFCYFGPWDDPDGALAKYLDQRDDLYVGRTPRVDRDGLTVRDLLNHFLSAKEGQLDTGEITPRTFLDYKVTCTRIAEVFGLKRLVDDLVADDFQRLRATFAKTNGVVSLGNHIQRVRVCFKYAYDAGLVDKPIRYGPTFKRPSKMVLRKARLAKPPRIFEPDELRTIIQAAPPQLRAMILLGVNCGFGNHDVGTLPKKALDLDGGWVDYARPKTAVERRCPLWPETIEALRVVIEYRREPKDRANAGLVFITKYGQPWSTGSTASPVSAEMGKLLRKLGIHRQGVGFYALRHCFETYGGESRDQAAVDRCMGHSRDDMASVYRERISDDRLRAVTDHVHTWLFGE